VPDWYGVALFWDRKLGDQTYGMVNMEVLLFGIPRVIKLDGRSWCDCVGLSVIGPGMNQAYIIK
jgi:hypothetical protein